MVLTYIVKNRNVKNMRNKYHSYSSKRKNSFFSSSIVILILSIVLILLLGNYLVTLYTMKLSSSHTADTKSTNKATSQNQEASDTPSIQDTISSNSTSNAASPTIIIDAGHGGPDPGKVSDTGTLEKDINLNIALHLKEMLENQDINVIMIREEDKDLATDTKKRKMSDIKERVNIMETSNADMVISIHQNSYPDSSVYGAQCFYPTESEEGKALASIIQNQIVTSTNQTKIREIKPNNDYYLLKHSTTPIVIVECGFLTNPEEEQLLLTNDYQRKMAWAIHMGVLEYINQK